MPSLTVTAVAALPELELSGCWALGHWGETETERVDPCSSLMRGLAALVRDGLQRHLLNDSMVEVNTQATVSLLNYKTRNSKKK